MILTRLIITPLLAFAMLLSLGGCYEKVTYSRQYPGWRVTDAAPPPTAHDYSGAATINQNQGSNFDPIGAVFKPIASVARGIGEVGGALGNGLTGNNGNNANDSNSNSNNTGDNANNSSSAGGPSPGRSKIPTADPGGGIGEPSPFDTSPE